MKPSELREELAAEKRRIELMINAFESAPDDLEVREPEAYCLAIKVCPEKYGGGWAEIVPHARLDQVTTVLHRPRHPSVEYTTVDWNQIARWVKGEP